MELQYLVGAELVNVKSRLGFNTCMGFNSDRDLNLELYGICSV